MEIAAGLVNKFVMPIRKIKQLYLFLYQLQYLLVFSFNLNKLHLIYLKIKIKINKKKIKIEIKKSNFHFHQLLSINRKEKYSKKRNNNKKSVNLINCKPKINNKNESTSSFKFVSSIPNNKISPFNEKIVQKFTSHFGCIGVASNKLLK